MGRVCLSLLAVPLVLASLAMELCQAHASESIEAISPLCAPDTVLRALERLEGGQAVADLHRMRCAWHEGRFPEALEFYRSWDHVAHDFDTLRDAFPWWEDLRLRLELASGEIHRTLQRLLTLQRRQEQDARLATATQARRLYLLALAYEAAGDHARADLAYRRVLVNFPGSEAASRVAPRYAGEHWPASLQIERAAHALRERNYAASEALLRSVVCREPRCTAWFPSPVEEPDHYEAVWQLSFLLHRYRRERADLALPWLRLLSERPGPRQRAAMEVLGHVHRRLQNHDAAHRVWRQLAALRPGTPEAIEDEYLAAMALFEAARWPEASEAFDAWLQRYPRSTRHREVRWWLGWTYFELERCEEATEVWRSEPLPPQPLMPRQQQRYWTAVCAERLGRPGVARQIWMEIASEAPLDWYGALALMRLNGSLPETVEGPRYMLPVAPMAAWTALARHGFHAEADLLLEMPRSWERSPQHRLAWRSAVLGDHQEWRTHVRRVGMGMGRVPETPEALLTLQLRYPPMHGALVLQVAGLFDLPPSVIWAVMMQESAMDPRAISVSDAMGLMQVIPQTAYAIARRMGEGYFDGMLFEPRHAVRYGAWYLAALRDEFDGQLPLAILAYNAGPVVVRQWVEVHGGRPLDEFVEVVPWVQARNYVRLVTQHMLRYEAAWNTSDEGIANALMAAFPGTVLREPRYGIPF